MQDTSSPEEVIQALYHTPGSVSHSAVGQTFCLYHTPSMRERESRHLALFGFMLLSLHSLVSVEETRGGERALPIVMYKVG